MGSVILTMSGGRHRREQQRKPYAPVAKRLSRRQVAQLGVGAAASVFFWDPRTASASSNEEHGLWHNILRETVSPAGWVDYARIATRFATPLADYLQELAGAPASFANASVAKAFWINAYNAVCIKTLLDEGLPDEVPHGDLFEKNIFTIERYEVAGELHSLDDIEHRILRSQYGDPRIHAAVVCGASSCPRLRPEAYVGPELDRQLTEECRSWIRSERTKEGAPKNYLDRTRRTYFASRIFDWYEEDFDDSDGGILRFISRHATPADELFMEWNPVGLEFLDYSWQLNSQ